MSQIIKKLDEYEGNVFETINQVEQLLTYFESHYTELVRTNMDDSNLEPLNNNNENLPKLLSKSINQNINTLKSNFQQLINEFPEQKPQYPKSEEFQNFVSKQEQTFIKNQITSFQEFVMKQEQNFANNI